jgi:hypothetical protein
VTFVTMIFLLQSISDPSPSANRFRKLYGSDPHSQTCQNEAIR